jgi:hypothetical protein
MGSARRWSGASWLMYESIALLVKRPRWNVETTHDKENHRA